MEKTAQLIGYIRKKGKRNDDRMLEELTLRRSLSGRNYYAGQLQNEWPKGTKVIVMSKNGEIRILFGERNYEEES